MSGLAIFALFSKLYEGGAAGPSNGTGSPVEEGGAYETGTPPPTTGGGYGRTDPRGYRFV